MFSGQGSHYFQMGRSLYERDRVFRACMDDMDRIARELCGQSVVATLYHEDHDKSAPFARTLLTHPAIFMVEHALAQVLLRSVVEPQMVLGASLGMFAASTVAGCLDMEDALVTVIKHAAAMEARCETGAMIAVLGDLQLFEETALHRYGAVAAVNFRSHFVIATSADRMPVVEMILRNAGATFQRLAVSFGFHSQWIDPAEPVFRDHLRRLTIRPAHTPLICCAESRALQTIPAEHFWTVTRQPIRFLQTIEYLESQASYHYVDVGPAGTLSTFTKYAMPATSQSQLHSILSPFDRDLENLAAVIAKLRPAARERLAERVP